MTVAKIYDNNPNLIIKNGLIKVMQGVLSKNKNPIVLCNTLLALSEMERKSNDKFIILNEDIIKKLM